MGIKLLVFFIYYIFGIKKIFVKLINVLNLSRLRFKISWVKFAIVEKIHLFASLLFA